MVRSIVISLILTNTSKVLHIIIFETRLHSISLTCIVESVSVLKIRSDVNSLPEYAFNYLTVSCFFTVDVEFVNIFFTDQSQMQTVNHSHVVVLVNVIFRQLESADLFKSDFTNLLYEVY